MTRPGIPGALSPMAKIIRSSGHGPGPGKTGAFCKKGKVFAKTGADLQAGPGRPVSIQAG